MKAVGDEIGYDSGLISWLDCLEDCKGVLKTVKTELSAFVDLNLPTRQAIEAAN